MVAALQMASLAATKVIFLNPCLAVALALKLGGNRKRDLPKARISMPRS
jgi:hypothetical protein